MHLRALPLALVTGSLIALAGCGGGDGGSSASSSATAGPDPATVAPPSAALYGEVVLKPGADVESGVLAAARKVLQIQEPAAELHRLIDRALAEDRGHERYATEVRPWLGQRAGGFLLTPARGGSGDADGAFALAVRDHAALETVTERLRAEGDQRPAGTYRGIAYDRDADDATTVSAIVGDFYVGGTLRGLRAAIDASKGSSLADGVRYRDSVASLIGDRLAFLYAEPRALKDLLPLAAANTPAGSSQALLSSLGKLAKGDPATLSLTAHADEISLELNADAAGTPLFDQHDGGLSIGELPGDAWLALATPALGPVIRSALEATGVHDAAATQVRSALGLGLDHDLLDPLGGLAVFARGTGVLDLGGGAMLKLSSAEAASTLLTRVQAIAGAASGGLVRPSGNGFVVQIPRSPQPVVVLSKGDRIAAGYAASSTKDLLDPQRRFDDSAGGKAAIASLGEGFTPSLVLLVPPLAQLLSSLDEIGIADLSPALPYLRAYRSLAVGTKHDGDRVTIRIVAALR